MHLVLENFYNEARRLARGADGKPLYYTAQWNDDVHHVLHAASTGEDKGYYADYIGDIQKLGRALAEGFVFQGEMMAYRGEPRGEPSASLPPPPSSPSFRITTRSATAPSANASLPSPNPRRCAPSRRCTCFCRRYRCCSWARNGPLRRPFPFFCDFVGELADAVRKGRRKEFAKFPEFKDEKVRARIPDPQAEATFASAKLNWDETATEPHAAWLEWYRRLLAVRRAEIAPRLAAIGGDAARFELIGEEAVLVRWRLGGGEELVLAANLSATPREGFPAQSGRILWQEGVAEGGRFGPWTVRWSIGR